MKYFSEAEQFEAYQNASWGLRNSCWGVRQTAPSQIFPRAGPQNSPHQSHLPDLRFSERNDHEPIQARGGGLDPGGGAGAGVPRLQLHQGDPRGQAGPAGVHHQGEADRGHPGVGRGGGDRGGLRAAAVRGAEAVASALGFVRMRLLQHPVVPPALVA